MFRLDDSVSAFEIDGETILLDTKTGRYYGLNPTASAMLAAALTSPNEESALTTLQAEFEAEEERLKADLQALLDDLKAKNLAGHGAGLA
jgi:hypothetical protein